MITRRGEFFFAVSTHSKVGDKTPLLHGLAVRRLGPDQGEGECEPWVVRTHHHG